MSASKNFKKLCSMVGSPLILLYFALVLLVVLIYGRLIFEPLSGDALMHVADSNQIKSFGDAVKRLFGFDLTLSDNVFRLDVFYRPLFNDFYISLLKYFFDVNPLAWRVSTLVVHGISGVLALTLFSRLNLSLTASFLGASFILLSPALFFGIYEFGLSFSQLLIFFGLLSLLSALTFVRSTGLNRRIIFGVSTLATSFFVVFTKESAALWPFVVICFICFVSFESHLSTNRVKPDQARTFCWKGILTKSNFLLFFALTQVTVIYFIFRYIKFGSFTSIAAGIEGDVNLFDSIGKFYGYVLYMFGVPTSIFPGWLSVQIDEIKGFEFFARLSIFFTLLLFSCLVFLRSRRTFYFSLAAIAFAFLPIIKVTRNSPYYADLMTIGFAFIVAYGYSLVKFNKERFHKLSVSVLTLFFISIVLQSIYTVQRYIYNSDMWLARSQGISRSVMTGLAAFGGMSKVSRVIQIGDVNDHEVMWSIHHNQHALGSGFFANIGLPVTLFSKPIDSLNNIDNVLFIEVNKNADFKRLGIGPFPGLGELLYSFVPGFVVRGPLILNQNSFLVTPGQAIRLDCKRVSSSEAARSLVLEFSLSDGRTYARSLGDSYNLSKNPERFVVELISPYTATSFRFVESRGVDCSPGSVEGYRSQPFSIDDFSLRVNSDTNFSDPLVWIGRLERYEGGGVVVGPGPNAANVLFYPFPVSDNGLYLVNAYVKSDSSSAYYSSLGRLQINWHSENDAYISTSSLIFTSGADFKEEVLVARPPRGAKRGYLYVTPHSDGGRVVFKSMNLMLKPR